MIQIFIKDLNLVTRCISVKENLTLFDLKTTISEKFGLQNRFYNIAVDGKFVELKKGNYNSSINELGINNNKLVWLRLKL